MRQVAREPWEGFGQGAAQRTRDESWHILWAGAVSAVSCSWFDEAAVLLQRSTIQLAGWVKGSQAGKLGCWG
jgi:hypothetical protein